MQQPSFYHDTYLRSNHWQKVKDRTYSKYPECQFCDTTSNLNIHHKKYKSNRNRSLLFREENKHLIVLCSNCHFLWHKINPEVKMKKKYTERIQQLLLAGIPKHETFKYCQNLAQTVKYLKAGGLSVGRAFS